MLVLTRGTGDSLRIGSEICVRVMGIKGNRVKIGVDAPLDILVMRGELRNALPEQPSTASAALSGHKAVD